MAINKVEYLKDSKTPDFAVAGDSKTINSTNAQLIYEDVKDGNTEKLNRSQYKYLNHQLNNSKDTTDYETNEKDGSLSEDNIDETTANKEQGKNGQGGFGEGGTNVSAAAGLLFGQAILGTSAFANVSLSTILATEIAPIIIPTTPFGTALQIAGMVGISEALMFDDEFVNRMETLGASNEYDQSLEESLGTINEDLEKMNEELEAAADEATETEEGTEGTEGTEGADELTSLYEQLESAQANGDQALVEELLAQIQELEGSAGEEKAAINEEYIENNTNAHELADYTKVEADKLAEGKELGIMGAVNTAQLGAASALSFVSSGVAAGIAAKRTAFGSYYAAAAAAASSSLFGSFMAPIFTAISVAEYSAAAEASITATEATTAGGMLAGAAGLMAGKTAAEFVAGSKGNELKSSLAELDEALTIHDEFVGNVQADEETSTEEESSTETGEASGDATGGEGGTVAVASAPSASPTVASSGGSSGSSSSGSSGGSSGSSSSGGSTT